MDAPHRILFTRAMRHSPAGAYNDSHFGWHSPAPYLFIGVAAMLGLIGIASLILVCTWCRLAAGNLGEIPPARPTLQSMESGPVKPKVICSHDGEDKTEKVLVIMPGDHKPTFLAAQLSSVGPDCL